MWCQRPRKDPGDPISLQSGNTSPYEHASRVRCYHSFDSPWARMRLMSPDWSSVSPDILRKKRRATLLCSFLQRARHTVCSTRHETTREQARIPLCSVFWTTGLHLPSADTLSVLLIEMTLHRLDSRFRFCWYGKCISRSAFVCCVEMKGESRSSSCVWTLLAGRRQPARGQLSCM